MYTDVPISAVEDDGNWGKEAVPAAAFPVVAAAGAAIPQMIQADYRFVGRSHRWILRKVTNDVLLRANGRLGWSNGRRC